MPVVSLSKNKEVLIVLLPFSRMKN